MVAVAGTGWRLAPSLVAYVKEADRYYPQRDRESDGSIGDLAHQSRVSDHNPDDGYVHAVDLDEDLAPGLDLKGFAEKLRIGRDSRVKYVIYEGRVFKSYASASGPAWTWLPYSGSNAHSHHLHLSILHTDTARNDLSPWGFAPPEPESQPAPDNEDDMLIIHATDRRSRFISPMSCVFLDNGSLWELAKSGVRQAKVSAPVYDAIVANARAILGTQVVAELQDIEAAIEALDA